MQARTRHYDSRHERLKERMCSRRKVHFLFSIPEQRRFPAWFNHPPASSQSDSLIPKWLPRCNARLQAQWLGDPAAPRRSLLLRGSRLPRHSRFQSFTMAPDRRIFSLYVPQPFPLPPVSHQQGAPPSRTSLSYQHRGPSHPNHPADPTQHPRPLPTRPTPPAAPPWSTNASTAP